MLSNVIGAPFSENVLEQLYQRAARNSTTIRSNEEVLFLANKTAWVRMISSIDIDLDNTVKVGSTLTAADTDLGKYYQRLGINDTSNYPDGTSLAKRWILEAGCSINNGNSVDLRSGLGQEGAYGLGGIEQQGYRPMPGLTSVQIDTAGRLGSLRVANINFKVWNMNQLNVIEALYFRLGYSMLLEWGHTQYYTNKSEFVASDIYGMSNPFDDKLRKEDVQQKIAYKVRNSDGNYDGMLGIVSNFTWSFNQEGGYDCTVKLIGLGAIMDTMRINQAYTLPTGLIRGYYNALKKIEQLEAERKQREYDAAHPPITTGTTSGITTPAPLKTPINIAELLALARLDTNNAIPDDLLAFRSNYFIHSTSTYGNYYYQSQNSNAGQAAALNPLLGLFVGSQGFKQITPNSVSPKSKFTLDWQKIDAVIADYYKQEDINILDVITEANSADLVLKQSTTFKSVPFLGTQASRNFMYNSGNGWYSGPYGGGDVAVAPGEYIIPARTTIKGVANPDLGINTSAYASYTQTVRGNATEYSFLLNYTSNSALDHGVTRAEVAKAIDYILGQGITPAVFEIHDISPGANLIGKFVNRVLGHTSDGVDPDVPNHKVTLRATTTYVIPQVPFTGTASAAAKAQGLTKPKDVTLTFTVEFTDTNLIKEILPATPLNTSPPNTPAAASPTNTAGATNTTTSDQTNEAFESALTAMLAYVKTVTQAKGGGVKMLKKPYDLVEATKTFYGEGVLNGVAFTAPAKPYVKVEQTQSFDLTMYAQKGFNASLMANENLYGSIPPVDFAEMSKSYLVMYGQGGKASSDIASARVYITLGYLLAFLNNMCLIYDNTKDKSTTIAPNPGGTGKDKRPYVYIDFNPETNFCLTSPQQLSVDPLTCLIPFAGDDKDYEAIYQPEMFKALGTSKFKATENYVSSRLPDFRTASDKEGRYQGKIMNILLDVDYLIQTAHNFSTSDPEHSVNLKRYLEAIMLDVNKALGNFNVFRVAYLDESNTIQIRDDQWTPNPGTSTILDRDYYVKNYYHFKQVQGIYGGADISKMHYGQLPIFGAQSIARSFQFKTNLSTKLSSMIAISAQADSGSINAKDPSPLSHLNKGYVDRYKPRIQNPTPAAVKKTKAKSPENNDEAAAKAFNAHIKSIYGNFLLNADLIETAKNYYIERSAIVKTGDPITSAAPFIPADLEITIDGIGGIIMGQAFTIPEDRMPMTLRGGDGYTKVGFIVAGLTHTLDNNEWLTKIKGQMIKLRDSTAYGSSDIIAQVQNVPGASASGGGAGGSVSNCDLFLYLAWQQGPTGAAQHYSLLTGNGKITKYTIRAENIYQNWPAAKGTKSGNPHGGFKSAKGIDAGSVIAMHSDPTRHGELAEAFIDVQKQVYASKRAITAPLLNTTGKNRTGLPYATIKQAFDKYATATVTANALANFASVENGLETDTETSSTYQTMFQIDKTNAAFAAIIRKLSATTSTFNPSYTNYLTVDELVKNVVPIIETSFNTFKQLAGFTETC